MRADSVFAANELPAELLIDSNDPDVIGVMVEVLSIDRAARSIAIDRLEAEAKRIYQPQEGKGDE
jgi:hypothetical protein